MMALSEGSVASERSSVDPALELRGITKSFGSVRALRAVDISVQAGEVVCLVGENGAGKSTLSSVASGLVRPDAGTILVDGELQHFSTPSDAEEVGIRIAPQELLLCPNLTVAENVMLGSFPVNRSRLIDGKSMEDTARTRLDRLGLGDLDPSRHVGSLAVVERAFVQIARALGDNTRVLIADEPTAPMSGQEATRLLELLSNIRSQGVGVLYISHRLDEVLRIGDRVVVMRDGSVVDEFASGIGSHERLVTSMLGARTLNPGRPQSSQADQSPRLVIDGVSCSSSLESVSLTVCPGEIVGVYGIAGSGREAIGPGIFGALQLDSGRVFVDGNQVPCGDIRKSIAAGIGYVPAERRSQGLMLERSIRENLSLADLSSVSKRGFLNPTKESVVVDRWTRKLGVKAPHTDELVGRLSGGNQQKVLLARWLAAGSSVLVLDDPTRGVDIGSRAEIYQVLRQLADKESVAILVVSSDIEEIETLCERVIVLSEGRVVAALANPTQDEIAHAAYMKEEAS